MKHLYLSLLFACTLFSEIKAQVDVGDSLALVDFYNSTDGVHWVYDGNWLIEPVSTWFGITIENRRVTKIILLSNNLTGIIPESFGKLNKLSWLYLENNNLNGLPESFGNLSSLSELNLYGNQITSLPESFEKLNSLWSLNLEGNHLTSLPESFGNLASLSSLHLTSNQISNLPESFGNLSSLSWLDLSGNRLSNLPESFGNLNSLFWLVLNGNQLGSLPERFGNLHSLSHLDLIANHLSYLPESFGNLSLLSSLDLRSNQLNSLPESFGNLSKLFWLYLNYNQLSSLPESFGNLSSLFSLFLSYNQLENLPKSFENLSSLFFLDLSFNRFNYLPENFGSLRELGQLILSNNKLIDTLPSSILNFNYFTYIDVINNKLLFDIEPMVLHFGSFYYSPQANILLHQQGNILSVSAGGTPVNNTYEWYKDGNLVATIKGDSTYTITVDGAYNVNITNSICTQLTLYSDTINTGILPLTLLNFTASLQNKNAVLNWSTSNEINTAYFNIQRSTDGIHFNNAGSLNAKGSSSTTAMYSFTDAGITALAADKIFYRLQVTDKNGSYQYSKIIVLDIASVQNNFVVYPNPVKDVLHIQLNGAATFALSNNEGKILLTKTITGSGEINVAALPSGLYYLKNIETGEVKKVIVK